MSVQAVPFLLEDRLKERGAHYHKVRAACAGINMLSASQLRGDVQQENANLSCI